MLNLKKVAVTGGIASGKTTVCGFFEDLGAYILSADEIVHEILDPKSDLGKKVTLLLGQDVIVNGTFDRSIIAKKVFADQKLLLQLEQLIHPEVLKRIETCYTQVSQGSQFSLFVVEFPLLYETGAETLFDSVIVVRRDEKRSKESFKQDTTFEARSNRLLALSEKLLNADFVIVNDKDLPHLKNQVKEIYQQLS